MRALRGLFVLALSIPIACQPDASTSPPRGPAAPAASAESSRALAAAAGGQVSSADARGVPNFIWAVGTQRPEPGDDAAGAARRFLARFGAAHRLRGPDLESAELRRVRALSGGGYLAQFRQRVDGVEVYPSQANVLMRSNLELVAIGGHLQPTQVARDPRAVELTPAQALVQVVSLELGLQLSEREVIALPERRGDFLRFDLMPGAPAVTPEGANVKRVYFAGGERLEPAYFVELYLGEPDTLESHALRYVIAAGSGRVLERRSLTASDAFTYRVWAETAGVCRPFDGPTADYTPHPTGIDDGLLPSLIAPNLVTIEGFNRNPSGQVDPWLPGGASQTAGNNVDAYSDDVAPDGYSNGDLRATTTGPRAFDRTFDFGVAANASEAQTMASVTELFYVTNWLHDWWYDSGFDEASGNAQRENFGRGGVSGDVLRAEAQDSVTAGSRNNANMSTPSDGLSPRMQMYQWSGQQEARLTVTPGGVFTVGTAAFGPASFDVTAAVVVANDGIGAPGDACESLQGVVTGRIVLADRGTCTFTVKAQRAQAAGAVGIIIADNRAATNPPALGGVDPTVTIPALSLTQAAGATVRSSSLLGLTIVNLFRLTALDLDGALDHMVVAHEWGHYLHHRLQDCGSQQCRAMSEGWADWVSLYMMLREGDPLDAVYATGAYATQADEGAGYFGIRRTPYSTNLEVDGLSFRHISEGEALPTTPFRPFNSNSEVHNAGEVWATMMWEAYVAILRRANGGPGAPSFDEMQRRMADYVVTGLQLTGVDPTFTETRDGVLAAAAARDVDDLRAMAQAFARRGAGTCAVSPPVDSGDFVGVVESFAVQPRVVVGPVTVDTSLRACDGDDVLDAEERGVVRVSVANGSPAELTDLTVTLSALESAVQFPAGAQVQVPAMAPFSQRVLEVEIALDGTLTATSALTLRLTAASPSSCEVTQTSTIVRRVNTDSVRNATVDDVESDVTHWTIGGEAGATAWSRTAIDVNAIAWYARDLGSPSDTWLESPTLVVGTSTSFTMSFDHRYSFEADSTLWDGGLIELSPDDGQTWVDLSTFVDPGYTGPLTDTSGNPLGLRPAFSGTNASFPARDHVRFDLGMALAGQSVRVRFRVGTDAASGAYGWELDDIGFGGIVNTPFEALVPDATTCPEPLVAEAGPDQTVDPKAIVTLDGSGSTSEQNLPLTYAWTQLEGAPVGLVGADRAQPTFVAPELGAAGAVRFRLVVSDGTRTATDTVRIAITESAPIIADAGADQSVAARVRVVLDGSRSRTAAALPLTFAWAQTSGRPVTLSASSGAVVSFDAPASVMDEALVFTLTVSDGTRSVTDTVTVRVRALGALVADAGADQQARVGDVVVLDGTGSASAGGLPLTFGWTQASGTPAINLGNPTRAAARFTVPEAAAGSVFTFRLAVSDGTQTSTDTMTVTIRDADAITLTADAGADQSVLAGAAVALDGTRSRSSANLPLTYGWVQTNGPSVVLANASGAAATFTAPNLVAQESVLTFSLTVSDGTRTAVDTVTIKVGAGTAGPGDGEDEEGGCSCGVSSSRDPSGAALLAGVAAAWALARRRGRRA